MFVSQLVCTNAVKPVQNCLLVFRPDSDFRILQQNGNLQTSLQQTFLVKWQKYKTNNQKTKPNRANNKKKSPNNFCHVTILSTHLSRSSLLLFLFPPLAIPEIKWNMLERRMPWIESVFYGAGVHWGATMSWVFPTGYWDAWLWNGIQKDWWGICLGVNFSFVINILPQMYKCNFNSFPTSGSSTCLIFIANKPALFHFFQRLWPGGQDFTKREDEYVVATEAVILTSIPLFTSQMYCRTFTEQQLHKTVSFQEQFIFLYSVSW